MHTFVEKLSLINLNTNDNYEKFAKQILQNDTHQRHKHY